MALASKFHSCRHACGVSGISIPFHHFLVPVEEDGGFIWRRDFFIFILLLSAEFMDHCFSAVASIKGRRYPSDFGEDTRIEMGKLGHWSILLQWGFWYCQYLVKKEILDFCNLLYVLCTPYVFTAG